MTKITIRSNVKPCLHKAKNKEEEYLLGCHCEQTIIFLSHSGQISGRFPSRDDVRRT